MGYKESFSMNTSSTNMKRFYITSPFLMSFSISFEVHARDLLVVSVPDMLNQINFGFALKSWITSSL